MTPQQIVSRLERLAARWKHNTELVSEIDALVLEIEIDARREREKNKTVNAWATPMVEGAPASAHNLSSSTETVS